MEEWEEDVNPLDEVWELTKLGTGLTLVPIGIVALLAWGHPDLWLLPIIVPGPLLAGLLGSRLIHRWQWTAGAAFWFGVGAVMLIYVVLPLPLLARHRSLMVLGGGVLFVTATAFRHHPPWSSKEPREPMRVFAGLFAIALAVPLTIVALFYAMSGELDTVLLLFMVVTMFLFLLPVTYLRLVLGWDVRAGMWATMGLMLLVLGLISGPRMDLLVRVSVLILGVGLIWIGYLSRASGRKRPSTQSTESPQDPRVETILENWPFQTPKWLRAEVELVYAEPDGDRYRLRLVPGDHGYDIRWRFEYGPETQERVEEEASEWDEMPFAKWQMEQYGEFLIDVRRPLDEHTPWGRVVSKVDLGTTEFDGRTHDCIIIRSEADGDCTCVEMAPHRLLWKGPGRCPVCGDFFWARRGCEVCGGSGTCPRCLGEGVLHRRWRYAYEARTGILLETEYQSQGVGRKIVERLETLMPNVLHESFAGE